MPKISLKWTLGRHMRLAVLLLAVATLFCFSGCSVRRESTFSFLKAHSSRFDELVLSIDPQTDRVRLGGQVTIRVEVLNPTDRPVVACIYSWNEFCVSDSDNVCHGGLISIVDHPHYGLDSAVVLPPKRRLSWDVTITVPDLKPGRGVIWGKLRNDCGPGLVTARIAEITLLPAAD